MFESSNQKPAFQAWFWSVSSSLALRGDNSSYFSSLYTTRDLVKRVQNHFCDMVSSHRFFWLISISILIMIIIIYNIALATNLEFILYAYIHIDSHGSIVCQTDRTASTEKEISYDSQSSCWATTFIMFSKASCIAALQFFLSMAKR